MSLSVVINTKNSQETLKRALESVVWADEVIVVDMQSTDDTLDIARSFTKLVFSVADSGFVEPARQFAISQATSDWILVLDADEEIGSELAQVLQRIDTAEKIPYWLPAASAYYLPRKNIIFDKWVKTGWWPDYVLRFFRRGAVTWPETIHAVPVTSGQVAEFPARAELAILHHNYQHIDQFIARLNRYTTIQAQDHSGSCSSAQIFTEFGQEFLRRLFADGGIAESRHGMSLALMQSLYQALVVIKAWESQGFPVSHSDQQDTILSISQWSRQLNYWLADWQVQHTKGLAKIYWRVRRKLSI